MIFKTIFSVCFLTGLFTLLISGKLEAQNLYNVSQDTKTLRLLIGPDKLLSLNDSAAWLPVLKKYAPAADTGSAAAVLAYTIRSPIDSANGMFLLNGTLPPKTDTSKGPLHLGAVEITAPAALSNFPVSSVADALTQLIIERGKEELTATFFSELKTQLQQYPELAIAFPKTLAYLAQIQPYLYAGFLPSLRAAFFIDVQALPLNLGSILGSPRIMQFMARNPGSSLVWYTVPTLKFLSELQARKPIAEAIRDLYPGPELTTIAPDYAQLLRATVTLSESVRDPTGVHDWVSTESLSTLFSDPYSRTIFFMLLYEESRQQAPVLLRPIRQFSDKITIANQNKIISILNDFTTGYNGGNTLWADYKNIQDTLRQGNAVEFSQWIRLINDAGPELQSTLAQVISLDTGNLKTKVYFSDFTKVVGILGNFNHKQYSAGVMNAMLLLGQYILPKTLQPFLVKPYTDTIYLKGSSAKLFIRITLDSLNAYIKLYPGDNIGPLISMLKAEFTRISGTPSAQQLVALQLLYRDILQHRYENNGFDANMIYQKILKYATLMASLTEAKSAADVTNALDAAILPVGSSSIKYYTAFSISLNSYIGGGLYHSNYQAFRSGAKLDFNSIGAALPIGLDFSVSTRWHYLGAVSIFTSMLDLGAVASYRLSNPSNSGTQTLPAFTFQNLLAPGAFIVLNRILNTPLAIGIGGQRAPQLSAITGSATEFTTDPKWRFGAFISVDIPLFEVYSKALIRPLTSN